jgi:hypothetical protein
VRLEEAQGNTGRARALLEQAGGDFLGGGAERKAQCRSLMGWSRLREACVRQGGGV